MGFVQSLGPGGDGNDERDSTQWLLQCRVVVCELLAVDGWEMHPYQRRIAQRDSIL